MAGRRLGLLRDTLRGLLGDPEACHDLGATYATGDHGQWPEIEDAARAARWYRRGARRGHAGCLYDLGFMSILGEFEGADRQEGIRLLEESASRGCCEAIRLLVDLHARGIHGAAANPDKADLWSRKLADHLARHPEDAREHER